MAEGSRTVTYVLLTLGIIVIIYFAAPFVYDRLRGTDYGFTVEFVDQAQASTGEIVHLKDEDLAKSPELDQVLQGASSDRIRVNEKRYHYYRSMYPNYSQNVTGKRVYYEYEGQFFYLRYHRDDVNLL